MEAKKRLQKDLKLIEKDIKRLKKQKKDIEKQLIEMSTTFKEKFQIWYFNGKKGHKDWILRTSDYPLLGALVENSGFERNKTISLLYLVGEEVLGLFEGDDYRELYYSEEEYQAEILKYQPLMEEAMNNNIKSYTHDW